MSAASHSPVVDVRVNVAAGLGRVVKREAETAGEGLANAERAHGTDTVRVRRWALVVQSTAVRSRGSATSRNKSEVCSRAPVVHVGLEVDGLGAGSSGESVAGLARGSDAGSSRASLSQRESVVADGADSATARIQRRGQLSA